jgi:hypothetical protein
VVQTPSNVTSQEHTMNDLAFGTTLLASFVALVAGVFIEATPPNLQQDAAIDRAARTSPSQLQLAQTSTDCAKVAKAPEIQ